MPLNNIFSLFRNLCVDIYPDVPGDNLNVDKLDSAHSR